jgi:ribose-phosphate pyrophosphokinase
MHIEPSFLLFAGSSHRELGEQIARCLGVSLGKIQIETFPDEEIGVQILENVRGRDVFVLQTIARRPNFYLMELLIIVDALKRASAKSITAVIPYFGYARQDRKDKGRVPITAKLVANLLEKAGVSRVLTMDLHAEQIQGFFDIPVDNLYARPVLIEHMRKLGLKDYIVVTPDIGSIKLAKAFAKDLESGLAIVDKRRVSADIVEVNALIGEVKDKEVLLVDDICSTGGTLKTASWMCKQAGARRIYAAVTHGLLLGKAFEESAIEKMLLANTIPLADDLNSERLQVVSIAGLFAKAIDSIVGAKSISSLFRSQ